MPFALPLPDSAPGFVYRAPPRTLLAPHTRTRSLQIAGAIAAVVLAIPFVAIQQGGRSSAAAAVIPVPSAHLLSANRTHSEPGELTPTAFAIDEAKPFVASYNDAASATRAETCLTEAIYYEGALEPEHGQRAIAQVVLNRVRHPAYPDTVCGVVFQGQERSTGCQFTFTCDDARSRSPVPNLWRRANLIAKAALGGAVEADVGLATHYHADYVNAYWSTSLDSEGQIGRHLFYRWKGRAGQAGAFSMRYSGREPMIAAWKPRPVVPEASAIQPAGIAAAGGPIPGSFAVPKGSKGHIADNFTAYLVANPSLTKAQVAAIIIDAYLMADPSLTKGQIIASLLEPFPRPVAPQQTTPLPAQNSVSAAVTPLK